MTIISFNFKAFQPSMMPQPVIRAIFEFDGQCFDSVCLIDSGADFCTLPKFFLESNLNIVLEERIAPAEIKKEWQDLDKSNKEEYDKFVAKLIKKSLAIPATYGCSCGRLPAPSGYFFPVKIKLGSFSNNIMVLWTDNKDIQGLLGRKGIFDEVKQVVFNKKEMRGFFEI